MTKVNSHHGGGGIATNAARPRAVIEVPLIGFERIVHGHAGPGDV